MSDDNGIRRVVIATDLSAESVDLFAHGLALVLEARAELFLLHIADHDAAGWHRLPTVRALLERWGKLAPNASQSEFEALGIRVHPVDHHPRGDLAVAVARGVAELMPDVLLLGTHQRSGFERLFAPSISEPVARDVHRATLFVADHARGLVDPATGRIAIARVVVPVTADVPQQPLIDELTRLLEALGVGEVSFRFVHVGAEAVPVPVLPARSDWRWSTDVRKGQVVEQILQAEVAHEADLIAMATRGRDSFLDTIRGTTTERVVRRARCPVFTVPVG